jgi:DNA-binding transcriptional LysR family regulator
VTFRPVLRERFALVLPRAHALARSASVTWAEALEQDFISFPPGSGGYEAMQEPLAKAGLVLKPLMTFAQSMTAMNMVAGGAGVAALPMLGCPPASHRVLAVRPLTDPPVDRELGVLRSARREAAPATLALEAIAVRCMAASRLAGLTPAGVPADGRRRRNGAPVAA